jgi:glycosyltransferase involved in cell wall biosynthesis
VVYLALDRASARLARRIIATSEAVAADLVASGQVPARKLVTIPNRPDPRDLAPTRPRDVVRRELGAGASDALIGVIARLTEQKGVADFLDALARLAHRPGWQAAIVGDGPQRAELEARAYRLGLEPRCRFVGTRTDLGDVLGACDLLVVPSRSEGLPYVVLEAMVVGTPLIATRVGGIPEVILDGVRGVLVPPRAPDRLAAAITAALENPLKSRVLADAARRHAAATLSLDGMLEAVAAVYGMVLGEAMAK